MKVSCNFLLPSKIFLMLLGLLTANKQSWKLFKKVKKVPALAWEDIISNHSVRSEIDCAFNCGNEPTCDEFKYKFGTNSPSVNCQLSNTTGKNNMANYDGQGWVFFIDVTKKLKHYSSTTDKEMTTTPGIPTTVLPHECFAYTWLNESNRNQKYSQPANLCDSGLSGWYRFGGGAGIKMSSSCLPWRKCGTSSTGWMNGTQPKVADGKVTRKVCYGTATNCCYYANNIEVVNCGQYYVYKLIPPRTCLLRYCGSNN